jgi:hypothetical protein
MRTDQAGLAQLRGYQTELARPQVRAAERGDEAQAHHTEAAEAESPTATPRDLGKGRLLDIYG